MSDVLEPLVDWLIDHHARGGEFSADAVQAAGEAVIAAELSGLSPDECFKAGRTAYFDYLNVANRRVTEVA